MIEVRVARISIFSRALTLVFLLAAVVLGAMPPPALAQSAAAPSILNPAEELADFDPRGILRWTSVAGADTYEVVAFDDVDLKNQVESSKGQRSGQYQFTQLAPGKTYYVKLFFRINGVFNSIPTLTIRTATTVVKPRLINPQDELDAFGQNGTLRWNAVAGADVYELWIYRDATLKTYAESSGALKITQYQISTLKPGTTYYAVVYARVNGVFQNGGALTITVAAQTSVARILNPQDELDAFATDGLIRWSPVTGADAYEVWVYNDAGSTVVQETSGSVTTRAWAPKTLQAGKTYYPQVYARVNGTWRVGAPVKLTTASSITRARLTNPQEDLEAFKTDGTLTWTAVTGATNYEVWIYGDAGLTKGVENSSTTSRSYQATKLCKGGTYFVSVFALVNGTWTSGWTTRINVTQGTSSASCTPPVPKVTLTSSADEVLLNGSVTLTWSTEFADSCAASTDWSGTKATSGTETLGPLNGPKTYTLTCTGKGGSFKAEKLVTLKSVAGINVSPTSVTFPSQALGTVSDTQSVTLFSTGTGPLSITSATLSGSNASEFSVANTCTTIQPGASCAIRVTFTPASLGSKAATLTIVHSADSSPTTVAVTGTAIAAPTLSVSASPLDLVFNDQLIGSASAAQTVSISNTGNAAVDISQVSFVGDDATQFSQTNNCTRLNPGTACTVNVVFRPTSGGSKRASLSVTSSAANSSLVVPISKAAGVLLSAGRADLVSIECRLGGTTITLSCANQALVVNDLIVINFINGGGATLSFTGTPSTATNGIQYISAPTSVEPGASGTIIYRVIRPTSACESGTVTWAHNGTASPFTVPLQINLGGGACAAFGPLISVSPASLDFGNQLTDTASGERQVSIRNVGSKTLTVLGLVLVGTDANQFQLNGTCGELGVNEVCSVGIVFSPNSQGAKSASIRITHDATGSPTTVALSGTSVLIPLGESSARAVRSAEILKANRPDIASGVYWFDTDGPGGNPPFQAYADMTTNGGGWIQVRRIPGTGAWYSAAASDNLVGSTANNAFRSNVINSTSEWSVKFDYFVDATTEYMFAAGDGDAWCVMKRGADNFAATTDPDVRATIVLASSNVGVAAGGSTNVLLRSNVEDPWIGCEGSHLANAQRMLYGEGGFASAPYINYKNAHNGINVFVRGGSVLTPQSTNARPAAASVSLEAPTANVSLRPALTFGTGLVGSGSSTGSGSFSSRTIASPAASLTNQEIDVVSSSGEASLGGLFRMTRRSSAEIDLLQQFRVEKIAEPNSVIAANDLPKISQVEWRVGQSSKLLPTTAWVRACGDRVWSVLDGYQTVVRVGDLSLATSRTAELGVTGAAEATLITGATCGSDGAINVSGYAFGVGAMEPGLSIDTVTATRFEIGVGRTGAVLRRVTKPVEFSVSALCSQAADEQLMFCEKAMGALER